MARPGRKRKPGKRYPNGRRKRATIHDKGCDGYQRRKAKHEIMWGRRAAEATDAPGRAWAGGLLNDMERDACRVFNRAYWSMIPGGSSASTLAQFVPETRQMKVGQWMTETERDEKTRRREQMVIDVTNRIDGLGRHVRRAFDMVAIDMDNIEDGPEWLERLLYHRETEADHLMLKHLKRAIRELF